ncbi:MAG: cupin domain-containing protein [Chitinophagales bacterium]
MSSKQTNQFMLVIMLSLFLIACGQGEKKADESQADTANAAKADTAKVAPPPAMIDAVVAAPNLYKTLKDTLGIRILEADYKPGDSSILHSHPDLALYMILGGKAEFIAKDGTKNEVEMKSGMENITPAGFHSVKNVGKTELKVLLVEVNRPMGAGSFDASMDASKVAGDLYKVIKDSLGIRILEATYKPGQSSKLHAHPDLAMYVISGGSAEFTAKDGKKQKMDFKTGMSMVVPADTHAVKNVGKTLVKVLLVEVNRPMK